jgi:hypothetical protein
MLLPRRRLSVVVLLSFVFLSDRFDVRVSLRWLLLLTSGRGLLLLLLLLLTLREVAALFKVGSRDVHRGRASHREVGWGGVVGWVVRGGEERVEVGRDWVGQRVAVGRVGAG